MKVKDITNCLQSWAPIVLQESYDNAGLIVGDSKQDVSSVLITLDVTMEVIDEAIATGCNLIVAHHPLIFGGIKKLTPDHWVNRCVIKAIKHDIAIYAIHTNLDNVHTGVNHMIASKLGLTNTQTLRPKSQTLQKLVTFIPTDKTQAVLDSMFNAGAGEIGDYNGCSFRVTGTGTFTPSDEANPAIGAKNQAQEVTEDRVEILLPTYLSGQVVNALKNAHPYEEVAYYLSDLKNKHTNIGSGMMGTLPESKNIESFISQLKKSFNLSVVRATRTDKTEIKKVALCGGSGSFLLQDAIQKGADVFITGDFKYHEFFEADGQLMIADIGHYESEVFTKDLLGDFLREKFANIALRLSEVNTNPIIYL